MMTSTGSGSFRVGGGSGSLSSSSNLSPLAPPFRVDKLITKPNPTNPSVSYPDVPMYGPYFDPSGQFWNSSSSAASGTNYVSAEGVGTGATCPSSTGIYGYTGSQPSTAVASAYNAASGGAATYDPFSYDPFSKNMASAVEESGKPFYPPYVPQLTQKDGYLSLGVGSSHGYDLLSKSGSAYLSSGGSSQVDHPQARSTEGDYKPNWGSFWSGVSESEPGKWSEYAQGFGSKNLNMSDLSSSKSPFLLDVSTKSQTYLDVSTHPFVDGSSQSNLPVSGKSHHEQGLPLQGEMSTVADGCFDIFGGAYHLGSLGIDQQDSRSLLDCSRKPTTVSAPISNESPHLQEPYLESFKSFSGCQKAIVSSGGEHFGQSGLYVFGCTSTTSAFPATLDKLPNVVSSTSAENTFLPLKLNSIGSDASNKSNYSARYDSSYQMDPQIPLGLKRQSSVVIRRPESLSKAISPSQIGRSKDSRFEGKDLPEKIQFGTELSPLNLETNDAQVAYSTDSLSGGSDVHNPAEDSPCWRGASSNCFSPFGVPEGVASDVLVNKLDTSKSLNTEDSAIKSLLVDGPDSRNFFPVKVNERDSIGNPLVSNGLSRDRKKNSSTNPISVCFDLNTGDGIQFAENSDVLTKEGPMLNKFETALDPIITSVALPISVGGEISSDMSKAVDSDNRVVHPPVSTEKSYGLSSNIENNCASSSLEDSASLNYCQVTSKKSDPKVDVSMLLKTIMKLSEILRCYCFSNQAAVAEEYSVAIKHIINNLNASMLLVAGKASPDELSPQGTSFQKELPLADMVSDSEAIAAAIKLGGTAEGFLNSASLKDDGHTIADAHMAQAIGKILHGSFNKEGEMDQHKLYKDLWLEAEASLCAMTAKARFLRLKAQMDSTLAGKKGMENSPRSNISEDALGAVDLTTQRREPSSLHECPESSATRKANSNDVCQGTAGNDFDCSGTISHVNDVEASVVARYQILKNRVENSVTVNNEGRRSSGEYTDYSSFDASGNDFHGNSTTSDLKDAENPVLARYQMLKCRANHKSLNTEFDPGEEKYLPSKDLSSPRYQMLDCQVDNSDSIYEGRDTASQGEPVQDSELLSNSVGVPEDPEASVIARFRIIQSRINHMNSVNKDQNLGYTNEHVVDNKADGPGLLQQRNHTILFGPYPDFIEDEDLNQVSICRSPYRASTGKLNTLNSEIFESWYGNDGSSSDWEHVSKEDLGRQN